MKNSFYLSAFLLLSTWCTCFYGNDTKKTILITGGAGYIGSHTAWLATQKDYNVIVIDHNIKKRFPWATYFEADYADEKVLHDIFSNYNVDAVFHFAAYALVRESVSKPLDYYDNNLVKTIKLLEVMLKHNVKKIIFASSRTVYGDAKFLPITEDHPKNPISPYGRTKWMTELVLKDFHDAYGLEFVSVRFVNVTGALPEYGLGEDHNPETHVLPLLMHCARKDLPFDVFGSDHNTPDGTCIRSYIHIFDIAHAMIAAYEYLQHGGKSDYIGLGTDLKLSIMEMIHEIERFYNKKVNYKISNKKCGDSPELYTDYSKAKKLLGWTPQYTNINNILKTMDEYEKLKEVQTSVA